MKILRRILLSLTAAVAVFALAACGGAGKPPVVPSDAAPEGSNSVVTVRVIDNRYEPAEVDLRAGQAIRWVFEGSMEHDVVAADGSFVSELQLSGEYVHVFTEPGEFAYDCSVHPEMTGLVRVAR